MSTFSHLVHFVLTLLTGGFWIIVWVLCILICASGNRKRDERKKDEELRLLRQLVENSKDGK